MKAGLMILNFATMMFFKIILIAVLNYLKLFAQRKKSPLKLNRRSKIAKKYLIR